MILKNILTEQLLLSIHGNVSLRDSGALSVPRRRLMLQILKEMQEETKKRVEAQATPAPPSVPRMPVARVHL